MGEEPESWTKQAGVQRMKEARQMKVVGERMKLGWMEQRWTTAVEVVPSWKVELHSRSMVSHSKTLGHYCWVGGQLSC